MHSFTNEEGTIKHYGWKSVPPIKRTKLWKPNILRHKFGGEGFHPEHLRIEGSFPSQALLQTAEHVANPEPRRRFHCSMCSFSTIRHYTMKRHMITHSKQYFQCDMCMARFNEKCKLRNHLREVHQQMAPLSQTTQLYSNEMI